MLISDDPTLLTSQLKDQVLGWGAVCDMLMLLWVSADVPTSPPGSPASGRLIATSLQLSPRRDRSLQGLHLELRDVSRINLLPRL